MTADPDPAAPSGPPSAGPSDGAVGGTKGDANGPVAPATVPVEVEGLWALLRGVIDPELGSDIVDLGMARDVAVDDDGQVTVTIALTTAGCPLRAQIQRDVRTRIAGAPGVTGVRIEWTEMDADQRASAMARARWNVSQRDEETAVAPTTRVILVAAGFGAAEKGRLKILAAEAEALDEVTVTLDVVVGQVLEQTLATTDEQQQAAARVVVVLVELQVLRELADAGGQQRDLGLRRTGVGLVQAELLEDVGLLLGRKRHGASPSCRWLFQSTRWPRCDRRRGDCSWTTVTANGREYQQRTHGT